MSDIKTKIDEAFASVKLESLPNTPLGKVEVIQDDMTVQEAVEFLHSRKILSAPVRKADAQDDESWKTKYSAIVDMIKLVVLTLDALEADSSIPEVDEEAEDVEAPAFDLLPSEFTKQKLSNLGEDTDGWYAFLPLETTSTLLDAVLLLGTNAIKRLPLVTGPEGDIVNIVTQSSILHAIVEQLSSSQDLQTFCQSSLQEMGLADPKPVMSIKAEDSVKDAFDIIRQKAVSAVPVLGNSGEILGNISARHVYFVIASRNKKYLLDMSAKNFLARISGREATWDLKNTAVTCKSSDTLEHIMTKMDAAKVHRIYVCDEENRPLRVVALCDVLSTFVESGGTCQLL